MATRILKETHPVSKVMEKIEQILLDSRLILYYDVGKSTLALQNIDTGMSYFLQDTDTNEPVNTLPRAVESENLCHVTFKDSSGS